MRITALYEEITGRRSKCYWSAKQRSAVYDLAITLYRLGLT